MSDSTRAADAGRGQDLVVESLTVNYGKATAVDQVSITAPAGTVTAVVGPNGAGKSSLVLGVYGSVAAQGRVTLGGSEISKLSAMRRAQAGLALVPQGRALFPRMTVLENIQVMAELLSLPKSSVTEAMDRFPILQDRSASLAGVLSGGEQQMLVVTRALMARPTAILLDEMMTGLAPKIVAGLAETVAGLRDSGVAVLIADPSTAALRSVIDRGYVLVRGAVVAQCDDVATLQREYERAMGVIREELEHDMDSDVANDVEGHGASEASRA